MEKLAYALCYPHVIDFMFSIFLYHYAQLTLITGMLKNALFFRGGQG